MKTVNVILIVVLIIILSLIIYNILMKKNFNENYGLFCKNCNRNDWMGQSDCASCVNCGWCISPDGHGSCGIGDSTGPLFKDCQSWYHQGMCMWGPECDRAGPIYVRTPPRFITWFNPWRRWGRRMGRR